MPRLTRLPGGDYLHRVSPSFPIEARESAIHGTGIFATRDIAKGEIISEYTGRIITDEKADELYGDDAEPGGIVLLFSLGDGRVIDGAVGGSLAKFINHSCNPNCETFIEGRRVFVQALRAIRCGEEITYDYNLIVDEDADPHEERRRHACRCGARACRGTMVRSND